MTRTLSRVQINRHYMHETRSHIAKKNEGSRACYVQTNKRLINWFSSLSLRRSVADAMHLQFGQVGFCSSHFFMHSKQKVWVHERLCLVRAKFDHWIQNSPARVLHSALADNTFEDIFNFFHGLEYGHIRQQSDS